MMNNLKFSGPFGLYIHVPFCAAKCNYCDFYSLVYDRKCTETYLESLMKEIKLYEKNIEEKEVRTIYIGGGTPSLLTPDQIGTILAGVDSFFSLNSDCEITMEANPSSLTPGKIKGYNGQGINRLSLGIQSLNDSELALLGRLHDRERAVSVIEAVARTFTNFNLDLIFALPGQRMADWLETLAGVLTFEPPHLSLYNLEIEPETPLGKRLQAGDITEIDEELDAAMYLKAIKLLDDAGYRHYEISNFALPGRESLHNIIYWKYQPYLGLGPAAHSFTGSTRFYNISSNSEYFSKLEQNRLPVAEQIDLTAAEQMAEMIFMGLRLLSGVKKQEFYRRFGVGIDEIYSNQIEDLCCQGLLIDKDDRIRFSKRGLLLGNRVFMAFLPD